MKRLVAIAIGLSCLLSGPVAQACSCLDPGWSFVRLARRSEMVVRGKVVEYVGGAGGLISEDHPLAMEVEVQEVYKGKVTAKWLTVWGDNGMQCRPYVTQFPIGSEWVFSLYRDTRSREPQLEIRNCGEYWLPVEGGKVAGRVTVGGERETRPQTMSLAELRRVLRTSFPQRTGAR